MTLNRLYTMQKTSKSTITLLLILGTFFACKKQETLPLYSQEVYQTSAGGDRLQLLSVDSVKTAKPTVNLKLDLGNKKQKIYGFGASFTESSAWNLATIPKQKRQEVLTKLFSPTQGAGFSLTRTHINSCDYSNNHYTYVATGDTSLTTFSVQEDFKGFTGTENSQVAGIKLDDPSYDLLPMIKEAQNIKGAQFNIIASPWSPPSWMKTGETATMTNGHLKKEYYAVWAKYLSKYITAYAKEGVPIWAITPQNEPLHAHDARWDSNGFTPEEGRVFLRDYLGPQLVADGHLQVENLDQGVKVLIYDHNKSAMNQYVNPTYSDPEASQYAWGTGFHWYANSQLKANNFYADALDSLRYNWPKKARIHTESSIDIDANDPIGQYFRESTDYAGTFVPFDTYTTDIITDLNHGTQGYVEWCMILSHQGQPNPYDNFNSAPVLINPNTNQVTYTPLYYILSHFSKFIRPGAQRVMLNGNRNKNFMYTAAQNTNGSIAVVLCNLNQEDITGTITLKNQSYPFAIAANALQTIVLKPQ